MTQPHYIDREAVGVLIAKLRAVESSREPSDWSGIRQVTTNWYRNPDGPDAADMIEALFSRPPMEAVAWREKAQIVTEWLAMARETPKPLHSSLNYVPVSPSEFEALEAILQAMRGA